ncbi:acyclic terpene utilization AtuA family protein [Ottowia thiooxydans]|uniref:Terpene utilization protein AtuA n=1 Tax=Ottowia thiooxydans TaxID=219182 RepID=A0ABV2QHJ3_9BURK
MLEKKMVRIGGGSAYWGDSVTGPIQLVERGEIKYLMLEYLAELTMSILVNARKKDPELGYATDFIVAAMRRTLKDVVTKGIRVITNAGGVNPQACARALTALADELGVSVKIAVVEGDDVGPKLESLRASGVREMFSGQEFPANVASASAYLGAFPIARALDEGAQIVITGRGVDSALALGPLIHEFGWRDTDYDLLAAGSLAGHLLECSTQITGGLHTDWRNVPDWAGIGYPIAECEPDGSFVLTKTPESGGLVNRLTVGEQLIYELHDPGNYALPDVMCDFTGVTLTEVGAHRVLVKGAVGKPPTRTLKVSATYADGWRCTAQRTVVGFEAVAKAERLAEEAIRRCETLNARDGLGPFTEVCAEVLGSEKSSFGSSAAGGNSREVVLRLSVKHPNRAALRTFATEFPSFGTAGPPGFTGSGGGRASPQPVLRLFSFLLDKSELIPTVTLPDGRRIEVPFKLHEASSGSTSINADWKPDSTPLQSLDGSVKLRDLAVGRSGDKGDTSNVVLVARDPQQLALLWSKVTPEWVRSHLGHLVKGSIERYALPGPGGMNLVLREALGGGGMASLRNDPLGKTLAHILLEAKLD